MDMLLDYKSLIMTWHHLTFFSLFIFDIDIVFWLIIMLWLFPPLESFHFCLFTLPYISFLSTKSLVEKLLFLGGNVSWDD